jgi:hypothetical protein
MHGIIELKGDCTGYVFKFYLPYEMFMKNGRVDCSKLMRGECLLHSEANNLKFYKFYRAEDDVPFIEAHATSIFSEPKFDANVEVQFVYDFTLVQWVGFGIVKGLRCLKNILLNRK